MFEIRVGRAPFEAPQPCGFCSILSTVSEDVERFIVFSLRGHYHMNDSVFTRPDIGLAIKLLAYTHT